MDMTNRQSTFRTLSGDPQTLIPTILRNKIFESRYWKQECFALDAESLIDRARELTYIGFTSGGFHRPCPFVCLLAKLLQISPDMEILLSYLEFTDGKPVNDGFEQLSDLRYLRALTAVYMRLVCKPVVLFKYLESLYGDFRKLVILSNSGIFESIRMDQWIEQLLDHHSTLVLGFVFPHLPSRQLLVERGDLLPYESSIESELDGIV